MKIGFFELEGWEEAIIRKRFPDDQLFFSSAKLDAQTLPAERGFEVIVTFIDSRITPEVIAAFPSLVCVATRSTGYDHIDLAACKARGIKVAYVPGYGDHTVAEFTFGLMLALMRKIYQGIDRVKRTGSFSLADLRGAELRGKTLGVIGTGRIGREVISLAKAFGMDIVAYDPQPDEQFRISAGFSYAALEAVLAKSDIITVHCPLNDSTRHLINTKNIAGAKKGACLINTARGGVVSTKALVEALEQGVLGGAALDVLEEEGEMKDELSLIRAEHPNEHELKTVLRNHMLMKMPNVLITPHNAFNTHEALERILSITIENIKSLSGGGDAHFAS